jgi:hypothetical protein
MICGGVECKLKKYEAKKIVRGVGKEGYRRCSKCELFLKYDGIYCPCCSCRMKVSFRNNKARQKSRDMVLKNHDHKESE